MSDATAHHNRDIFRRDFVAFSHRAFRELNGAQPYLGNWHLEVMAAKLEAVRRGELASCFDRLSMRIKQITSP